MPLILMYEMLANGDPIWVAPIDQVTPHLGVKVVRDEFDRASLSNALSAQIAGESILIGPLELQITFDILLRVNAEENINA